MPFSEKKLAALSRSPSLPTLKPSRLQAAAFDYLDASIERVGAPFAPVPAAPSLEAAYLPDKAAVVAAVKRVTIRS